MGYLYQNGVCGGGEGGGSAIVQDLTPLTYLMVKKNYLLTAWELSVKEELESLWVTMYF